MKNLNFEEYVIALHGYSCEFPDRKKFFSHDIPSSYANKLLKEGNSADEIVKSYKRNKLLMLTHF